MDLGITDRVAIVAASSSGIGKATAMALAREGVRLAICARGGDLLRAAAREIESEAETAVLPVEADVTKEDQVAALVKETVDAYGRVDICVTNAAGPPSKPFAETTPAEWRLAVDLNLLSVVWFAREVLPLMRENRWGRFVTITSVAVKQPLEGLILSNSIRSAVTGLVKSLSNEYAGYGITVNNVCPGYTATERLRELAKRLGPEAEARWKAHIPAGRLAKPEEIADAIAFLCSERAAYVTGEAIAVDGGFAKTIG
jgi:3-oxoacyl-[acyl-carrier protein] reductase